MCFLISPLKSVCLTWSWRNLRLPLIPHGTQGLWSPPMSSKYHVHKEQRTVTNETIGAMKKLVLPKHIGNMLLNELEEDWQWSDQTFLNQVEELVELQADVALAKDKAAAREKPQRRLWVFRGPTSPLQQSGSKIWPWAIFEWERKGYANRSNQVLPCASNWCNRKWSCQCL